MSMSTVAIAGITGKLGTLIAQAILTTSQASIRGLCRDKSKLAPELQSSPGRITLVEGDSTDISAAREAVQGSQVVICCYLDSNELMTDGQKVLINACVAEGVPHYIASD
jgi:nucleoside-diphosphate-sugar epimerase